jgi:opacity protein-like surface antigen
MRGFATLGWMVPAVVAVCVAAAPVEGGKLSFMGSVYGGYSAMSESNAPGGSVGFRDNVLAKVGSHVGVGFELGYLSLGSTYWQSALIGEAPPEIPPSVPFDVQAHYRALQTTVQVLYQGPGTRIQPFATAGGGYYAITRGLVWQHLDTAGDIDASGHVDHGHTKFGYNFGAGAQYRPAGAGPSVGIEARYHSVRKVELMGNKTLHILTVMGGLHFD